MHDERWLNSNSARVNFWDCMMIVGAVTNRLSTFALLARARDYFIYHIVQ